MITSSRIRLASLALVTCVAALGALPAAGGAAPTKLRAGDTRAPVGQLRAAGVVMSHGTRFTRYRQQVGGVPVLGREAVLVDAPGARGDFVLDRTRRGLATPPQARIARADAISAAERAVNAARLRIPASAELAIRPEGASGRLVWRVRVASGTPLDSFEVLIDARSGAVVDIRDLLHHDTGQAAVFDPNPVVEQGSTTGLADSNDANSALLTSRRIPVTLQRLTNATTGCLIGQWVRAKLAADVCLAGANYSAVTRSDDRFEALMAYFHLDRTQAYVQSLGFTNVMNRQLVVNTDQIPDDNSFYDEIAKDLTTGTGGVDDAEDADVIVHEYGHAIQDDQVPGFGADDDGGAMGEGWGDYLQGAMSATYGTHTHPGFDLCMAEWDTLPIGDPCLRRLDSPLTLAQARDGRCGSSGGEDPHCVGEVWSAALWNARTHIGGTTMDKIVLQSHFALTPTATFFDASAALLAADQQINGGANRAALIAALLPRGLIDPSHLDDTPAEATGLGVPATVTGRVDAVADPHDVFRIPLIKGKGLIVKLTAPTGDLDLHLLRPGTLAVDEDGATVAGSTGAGTNESFAYVPTRSGDFYLDVSAASGAGSYTLTTILDTDGDKRGNPTDNCATVSNFGQEDRDHDRRGDACDKFPDDPANDVDHDGRGADADNCPTVANTDQADWDHDAHGNACDRSSKAILDSVRAKRGRLTIVGLLRPRTLGPAALRVLVQRRTCTHTGCRYRTVKDLRASAPASDGRLTVVVGGLRSGRYRVRVQVRAAAFSVSPSRWRSIRVRA